MYAHQRSSNGLLHKDMAASKMLQYLLTKDSLMVCFHKDIARSARTNNPWAQDFETRLKRF